MQFEDPRDAQDAIYGRAGYDFDGHRLRVSGSCMISVIFLERIPGGEEGSSYLFIFVAAAKRIVLFFVVMLILYLYLGGVSSWWQRPFF